MRTSRKQFGFTMLEVLSVLAVLAILVSMTLGLGRRIKRQAQENLCKSGLDIIACAIQQYYNQYSKMPFMTTPDPWPTIGGGDGFFAEGDLRQIVETAYGLNPGAIAFEGIPPAVEPVSMPEIERQRFAFFTSEALYFSLNRNPSCKRLIDTLSQQLIKVEYIAGDRRFFTGGPSAETNLLRFVDPWGNSIRYIYAAGDSFPTLGSMGADGVFGTADDIEGD